MAKKYSVAGTNNSQAAPATIINLIGSTAIRPRVFDILVGSAQTPADQAMQIQCGRTTAVGTAGSSPTPLPLDPADVASVSTAGTGHTAEPTYAATFLLQFGLNQRATFRWVAAPDSELVGSATASNGVGLKVSTSTATLVMNGTTLFFE
jgi:hypothetical protein